MTTKKVSELDAITVIASDDLCMVTDVSDTTSGASGTSKKITIDDFLTNSKTVQFSGEVDNGNSSTAETIVWDDGQKQKSTMTDNCTYTLTAPTKIGNFQLKLVQDATGSRLATWPASVKWAGGTAPTLSTDPNSIDIISFYYDGTNYFGVASLGFD